MSITLTLPGRTSAPPARPARAGAVAGRHRTARPSLAHRLLRAGTTGLLALAALTLLAMTVGPRVFDYRTATMLTGSMAPGIVPGDVVVDTPEPTGALRVGQIISYHIPVADHRVESHRVVWIGHDHDGTTLIRTKGDANPVADPWTARMSGDTVWRVRGVVPFAGTVIRALRTPLTHLLLTAVLPAALVLWLLTSIWRPRRERD